jgi:hypothetical protein
MATSEGILSPRLVQFKPAPAEVFSEIRRMGDGEPMPSSSRRPITIETVEVLCLANLTRESAL